MKNALIPLSQTKVVESESENDFIKFVAHAEK
jgi:hypothetical protein